MPRLPERLGKLRGKSFDELRVRCAQAAHARLERIGLSREAREPSDQAFAGLIDCAGLPGRRADGHSLLRRFRQTAPGLGSHLPGLCNPTRTAELFQARCPDSAAAAIAAAERIAGGLVDLADREVSVGARPDWMLEPVSGKRAPAIHWSRIAFLDPLVAGDCKFTWELNRHQYFVTLGRAYLLTGDDRYVSTIAQHLSSWMDDNPPKIGINWTSSLELALRAISWIWTLALVRNSPRLTGSLYLRTLKYLYLHARHIERNLSTYFSPNTHLTGEALGLLYVGTAFPEFKLAHHWRTLASRILVEQLDRQLFADGVYFEQSTYYHRYTTDFYLHALLLANSSGHRVDVTIRSKLHGLLDYLLYITRPDGTSPLIGDDDGGRLVMLGERATNDFRDTLAIGAAVLQRRDCAYVARTCVEELLWLLGPEGCQAYDRLRPTMPTDSSRAFAHSGYFVVRESWEPTADWAIMRCGPHAPRTGAHAHADALAVELSVGGRPMLIDGGTYRYTASRAERDYFRGSAAHNTVTVDGLSSAEPAESPFKWKSAPRSRARTWMSHHAFDFFEGEHDGYARLESPAVHSRAVFFLKGEYWVICDRIRSAGRHQLALHWHWAPNVTVQTEEPAALHVCDANDGRVDVRLFARTGRLFQEQGWVSTAYGTRTPAPTSVFRLDSEGTEEIVTLLASSRAALRLRDCDWRALSSRDAGILSVVTEGTRDTILTGPTAAAHQACDGITSDATWTWVRRSHAGEPLAFAVIQGRNLIIDNQRVFHAESITDWAVGQQGSDGWHVDIRRPGRPSSMSSRIEEQCAASVE